MKEPLEASSRLILDAEEIARRIRRIAYEIYERNFEESILVLAGIEDRGYLLAERLCSALDEISHFTLESNKLIKAKVQLQKFTGVQCEVNLENAPEKWENCCVVVVDDVLNTGRTLAYSLKPFLEQPVKKLEVAVLVNRSHIKFPVIASYTGYQLSTTLEEHIEVVLDGSADAVYLK
jgi:pyrimidine operon attenuation protein/uracil phosphoribosyltransferase